MRRLRWSIPLLTILVLGAGFGGSYWYAHSRSGASASFADLGSAPNYRLTNQLGRTVDSSQFLGKVQVVTVLFPYCTDVCPLLAAHLLGRPRKSWR